jgi:hypothetical protein
MSRPLSPFARAFLDQVIEQGYRLDAAAKQLRLMAHLSRWLAARELGSSDLTAIRAEEFLADRREGHRHYFSAKAINPLLEYLRVLGVAPAMASTTRRTASEVLSDRYSSYLLERRG